MQIILSAFLKKSWAQIKKKQFEDRKRQRSQSAMEREVQHFHNLDLFIRARTEFQVKKQNVSINDMEIVVATVVSKEKDSV
jgi:nitrogen fixation-related uncharacterized protein